jgi:hypothetical protein
VFQVKSKTLKMRSYGADQCKTHERGYEKGRLKNLPPFCLVALSVRF